MRDFKRLQVEMISPLEMLRFLIRRIPLPGSAERPLKTTSCSGMPLFLDLMKLHSRLLILNHLLPVPGPSQCVGWNLQINSGVQWRVSEQAAGRQIPFEDVPPQHLCGRRDLSGHFTKPLESHIRRVCHPHKYPVLGNCKSCPHINFTRVLQLSDPNPNSPANSMAAQLFKENRREYEKRVKACVEQSWVDCDD